MSQTPSVALQSPRYLAGSPDALRLGWKPALLIVLFGASLLSINLGGNRVLTYHEVNFAQPAREMLATGDFILPRHSGVPHLDKPPMTAWIIAASMAVFGSDAEWVARFPSIVAACLTALMVAGLAARWFGNRVGTIAGLMQLSSYYVLQLARLGECDIHLVTAVCAAMGSFALANVDGPRGRSTARWLPWTFYLAAGMAFLIKGPLGPAFIFAGCLLFLAINQDARGLRFFLNPVGLALFALCVLPWPLLAYAKHPPILDAWLMHNFGRFKGDLGGRKPALYYFYHLPLVLLPWFPFAAWMFVRGLRQGLYLQPLWRFTACWLLPGFTLLSLARFQSKHYLAPLLPAMSIAAALGLVQYLQWRHHCRRPLRALWVVVTIAGGAAAVALVVRAQPEATGVICALIVVVAAAMLVLLVLERLRWLNAQMATMFAAAWLVVAVVHAEVMPHHDTYRDQSILAGRINARLADDEAVYLVGLPDCQISYYLKQPLVRIDNHLDFLAHMRAVHPGPLYVLAPEKIARALTLSGRVEELDRCDSTIRWMKPDDRLTLVEFCLPPAETASRAPERR